MAESTELADRGPFWEFSLGVMLEVSKRFHTVEQLALWLEARDQSEPDELPPTLALACADLKREIDRLEDQVSDRMRELEELRKTRKAA